MKKIFLIEQIISSFKYRDLIIHNAFNDVKLKYIKTFLGAIWNSLSIMIFIICFGFVGSKLWGLDVDQFLPGFAASYIIWMCISNIIGESTIVLNANSNTIKTVNTPIIVYILSMILKNIIFFLHHMVSFLIVGFFFSINLNFNILFLIPSLIILFIISVLFSFSWSILCCRFNDLTPLTTNILQLLFFITPIFWPADRLTGTYFTFLVEYNPIYQILNILKQPLLGNSFSYSNIFNCLILIAILLLVAIIVGNKIKKKLIFFV